MINLTDIKTKTLVDAWNALADKPIKKFSDRKTAESRIASLLKEVSKEDAEKVLSAISCDNLGGQLEKLIQSKSEKRTDGKYNRKTPQFESDLEKLAYVRTQYATKTDHFPGRKSKFSGKTLRLANENAGCPYRENTVCENSFSIVANFPGIGYEEFRQKGGRNTDLVGMVNQGIVIAK